MDDLIQLVIFVIFGAVALFSRILSRRRSQEGTDTVPEEEEITLPPWGNVPMEEDAPLPDFIEVDETQPATVQPPEVQVAPQPEPVRAEPPPSPVSKSPSATPTIAGIPLSPQTFRQGIILAEILRPPKSLRRPQQ